MLFVIKKENQTYTHPLAQLFIPEVLSKGNERLYQSVHCRPKPGSSPGEQQQTGPSTQWSSAQQRGGAGS